MLSSVDLPQPLGPTTVRNSPALTSRLTPAIAWIVLPRVMKSRETSLSESIVMARLRHPRLSRVTRRDGLEADRRAGPRGHAHAGRPEPARLLGAAHRRHRVDDGRLAARRLLVATLVRADGGAVLRVAHARRDRAVADLTRGGPRAPSRRRARGPHAAHRPRASHAGGSPAHDHALAHRCLARLEPVDSCVAGGAPARRAGHRRLRVERPRGAPVVGAHPDGGSIAVAGQRADLDHRSAVARKSPHRHGDGASTEYTLSL